MKMNVRYLPDQQSFRRMTTEELRTSFVIDDLFVPGNISMVYCDTDRAIIGGAVVTEKPLKLVATKKEMAAEHFTERRELGILNLGPAADILVVGEVYPLAPEEMLYVGRGTGDIEFRKGENETSACLYFVSFPAHAQYPLTHIHREDAEQARLGSPESANRRTINRYIHLKGAKSCQLVMGVTRLESGSVWNTMPPHTHQRRMEIYLYFGLKPDEMVLHFMGSPAETRHVVLRNMQAVISPSWSIHSGVGTGAYSFVWAMGGENQEFSDMDEVAVRDFY